jgi:putative oxidoreductase
MATGSSLPPAVESAATTTGDVGGRGAAGGGATSAGGPEDVLPTRPPPITVVRWGIVAIFLVAGSAKLFGLAGMVALFRAVGFGQWFRYVVGAGEITGAILLAVPRAMLLGVFVLCALMVGAVGTDVFILRRMPISSVGTLSLLCIVLWSRLRAKQ